MFLYFLYFLYFCIFVFFFFFLSFFVLFVLFVFLSFCPFVLLSFLYYCIFVFLPFCLFVFLPFFLFVTTIIIPGSISTTTPIFIPIQQFFNFTTHFTTNDYHYCHPPPTTFYVPKRNTGKCFERTAKILRGRQIFGFFFFNVLVLGISNRLIMQEHQGQATKWPITPIISVIAVLIPSN